MDKGNAPKKPERSRRGFFPAIGRFFANLGRSIYRIAINDLDHPDVFRRMAAAGIWMFAIFVVGWLISYFLLRENLFAHTWLVDKFFGTATPKGLHPPGTGADTHYWARVFLMAGKIFLHYLVVIVGFIFILNHLKIGRVNLGYVFLFSYTLLLAGVVGTISFPYYAATRLAGLVVFIRFSLWQLLAFMLATVGTTKLAIFAMTDWSTGTWKKIRPWSQPGLKGENLEVLLYALLILIASCVAEGRLADFYKLW